MIVVHPDTGKPFMVRCKDPEMPPLTAVERDRLLKLNRVDPDAALSAYEALSALVEGFHHAPRKSRSKVAKGKEEAKRSHRDKEIVGKSKVRAVHEELTESSAAMLPIEVPTKRNKIAKRG